MVWPVRIMTDLWGIGCEGVARREPTESNPIFGGVILW